MNLSRRSFLKVLGTGAAAAALPGGVASAALSFAETPAPDDASVAYGYIQERRRYRADYHATMLSYVAYTATADFEVATLVSQDVVEHHPEKMEKARRAAAEQLKRFLRKNNVGVNDLLPVPQTLKR